MAYDHDLAFAAVEAFTDEVARAGVRHVCISPGARSTPLALAFTRQPLLRAWSHIDERSGAFFALGIAKATRCPVAVVCTSGTAAANLLPAIVEASYAHAALLVLTADRPAELRDCGAAQTIDQIKLYGSHVKWFVEVGTSEAGLRYFRTLGCRAVAIASASTPGPVHLNFPFREPLMPQRRPEDRERQVGPDQRDCDAALRAPSTVRIPVVTIPSDTATRELAATLCSTPLGLIVCGPSDADVGYAPAVVRLAKLLDYPILADPLSQVRTGPHDTSLVVDAYDALCRDAMFARSMSPDVILRFGPMPTSKMFQNYLQQHPACRHIVVDQLAGWNDPSLTATEMMPCDPLVTCEALCRWLTTTECLPKSDGAWRQRWLQASWHARTTIQRELEGMGELFEGKVFAELSRLVPDAAWLYVGNSMPVRDLESFWPTGTRRVRFFGNRGANGIDGFISSGLGAAAVADHPVVIVTGDLAFYHDLNGLLAAKRYGLRATIILINNDGGGIFEFLPQAQCGEQFAEFFLTPHGLDFRDAVGMYGCAFTRVQSWEQFRDAVTAALAAQRTSVIEVPSDRTRNLELHRQVWAAATHSLSTW